MSSDSKNLVILLGPTAVGKSAAAFRLALDLEGEIINCDSMQVYRGFDIGTDKPSPADLDRVPHHLLDICEPNEQFTAASFVDAALKAVELIHGRDRLPLITGGTGLYIKALTHGLFPEPAKKPESREALNREVQSRGVEALYEELLSADPEYAGKIGRRDQIRIIRALEVFRVTGIPLSEHFRATESRVHDYNVIMIGLRMERERLYRRIELRVDLMFARGIIEEVKGLVASGISEKSPPFRALGYKHVLAYLQGSKTMEEAIARTKIDTRHYAKRQLTWFNKMEGIAWFSPEDYDSIKLHITSHLR